MYQIEFKSQNGLGNYEPLFNFRVSSKMTLLIFTL